MGRVRLDALLVNRGLARSRAEASEVIAAGLVLVNGSVADKASRQVESSESLHVVSAGPTFVSRGGRKLDRGLAVFQVDPAGRTAVDAGSATGGFTDCLLQRGALGVVSVDVGYGQLHERLRQDPRVISMERTNIRDIDRQRASELLAPLPAPSMVVADLSFTSARQICATLLEVCGEHGDVIVLCKPQFEVGRQIASRGRGVVRERSDRQGALVGIVDALLASGAGVQGIVASPILGPAGNAEFLVHARNHETSDRATIETMIDAALDEAELL
jgi:23S rRNA (cytidine1920-2'-O)/16S rRNA (cytidine1409-2'-O)-methyltransferase